MGKYIIQGGKKLNGEICLGGAKNSVLPILASTVLNAGVCVLKNVPMLLDTMVCIDILKSLGCKVEVIGDIVVVNSKHLNKTKVDKELVGKMRSSIIFLGSILSRCKQATISYPGGCNLGKRPIDFHIKALDIMGADIKEDDEEINVSLDKVKSCVIELPFASVGATQNIILASVIGDSKVVLKNCAKEPEIVDMVDFLLKMGANITGAGSSTITIKGVRRLSDFVEYTIMPDRIEAGTFLCMGAITKGKVLIKNAKKEHLKSVIKALKMTGCDISFSKKGLLCKAPKELKAIEFLKTEPYPYFPTDMQPQMMSLLAVANGQSLIKETIFEARNKHISELNKLGADIKEQDSLFIINGKKDLNPNLVEAKDLRGGASLITLALCIDGETTVDGSCYVERGYENIQTKLQSLGADIKYIKN